MDQPKPGYDTFLLDVPPMQMPYVQQINALLLQNGCTVRVEPAKSGYVVSYDHAGSKRVLANFIFRKKGVMIRIYADHVVGYQEILAEMPPALRAAVSKAPICRRLHDPAKCNARCPMGNVFTLDGVEHKKCRYNNFIILVDEAGYPAIQALIEKEAAARKAA